MPIELAGGQDSRPKVLAKWGGLNTHADRASIPEDDFSWLENFFPIAPGNLRTTYAEGTNVYTTSNPRTIVALFPYNFGSTSYVALFLDDGSAIQVQASNGATTTIGAAGTFYSGGTLPACSQYQSKYLIIGSDVNANAYWVWDGTSLFGAGGLSPQVTLTTTGNKYSSPPTVTAYGGSGSGATFSATVANNVVVGVKCTNPGSGYVLNDQPTLGFSGGGSDTGAVAIPYVGNCSGVSAIAVTTPGKITSSTAGVTISAPPSSTVGMSFTVGGGGNILTANITSPGSGYFQGPFNANLPNSGGGSGGQVVLTPDPNSGQIVTATIVSAGTGYINGAPGQPAPFVVTATALATVTPDGSGNYFISAVTVTNPGVGYITPPTVTFTGLGSPTVTPVAQANITRGQITKVTIQVAGTNYTGNPSVVFSGANDPAAVITQTATGVATISGGAVTGVTLLTSGYGYQTASVNLSGGNNAASAICTLMPFGVQATSIETYNNQVWTTANPSAGPKMSFTAPNSVSDFGTFDGGGSAPATDNFLRRALIGLRQNSGFLYRFADSSINAVTNVTTASNGVTTYNNSNVDAQVGTAWRDTICAFDRAIVFANTTGVYALFGGAVQKVSDQLDKLFELASFNTGQAGVIPTAAVTTMFGIRVYTLLFTTTDPYSGTLRTIMACWNGQRWFCATQTKVLALVATQEINSVFTAWGTDGTHLFRLFQTASTGLTKVFQTRLFGAEAPDENYRIDNNYIVANLLNGASANVLMTVDVLAQGLSAQQTYALSSPGRQIVPAKAQPNGAAYGSLYGLTGTTTAADLSLIAIELLLSEYSREV